MKLGKLIKDKYFWDDSQSGLYFDLNIIKRDVPNENEDELNARIDKRNSEMCTDEHPKWFPTLFLTYKQWEALPQRYKDSFGAKTYLMIVDTYSNPWKYEPWTTYYADGFLWLSHDKVWTRWSSDNLGYRYRRADKQEVEHYEVPAEQPTITPNVIPSIPSEITINLHVWHHEEE